MSNTLDILVHVPRLSEAILVTIAPDATIIALEEHLRANGHVEATFSEVFVFKEGVLVALDRGVTLLDHGIAHGEHVHIHHRKEIAVSVHYMDGCIERPFSPHESVGNVAAWATKEFSLSTESSSYFLEKYGTNGHLPNSTRLYDLDCDDGRLALELVPHDLLIHYKVDAVDQTSDTRHRTARDILSLAGFDLTRYYLKHKTKSYKDNLDAVIRLHEGETFTAMPFGGGTVS